MNFTDYLALLGFAIGSIAGSFVIFAAFTH